MKCDELKRKYSDITGPYYGYNEVNEAIAELKDENERLNDKLSKEKLHAKLFLDERDYAEGQLRATSRALWIMIAEWADAMCLASCNIANKYMSRDRFEVGEDYREKTIRKYRHRQVVFAKYGEYCRAKADTFKEAK